MRFHLERRGREREREQQGDRERAREEEMVETGKSGRTRGYDECCSGRGRGAGGPEVR